MKTCLALRNWWGKLEKTAETHREIGAAFLHSTVWYERMSPEHKRRLAMLGRQVLNLMMSYVGAPQKRLEVLAQAREIGRSFGDTLAAEGVPLTDSVQAFISHRDPITDIVTEMLRKKELVGESVLAAMPLMEQIMDSALVSLVEAHQRYGAASKARSPLKSEKWTYSACSIKPQRAHVESGFRFSTKFGVDARSHDR